MTKKTNEPIAVEEIPFVKKIRIDYSLIQDKKYKSKKFQTAFAHNLETILKDEPSNFMNLNSKNVTEKEIFIEKLFTANKEIATSLKKLVITLVEIKNLRSNRYFSKEEMLQYYYEHFINELYIYTERILNLISLVDKKAEKLKLKTYYSILVKTRKIFLDVCEEIRNTRNTHNHKTRYNDTQTDKLQIINILSENKRSFLTKEKRNEIYSKVKRKYTKDMLKEIVTMYNITNTILIPIEVVVYEGILEQL